MFHLDDVTLLWATAQRRTATALFSLLAQVPR
jgi:hypothetical protein